MADNRATRFVNGVPYERLSIAVEGGELAAGRWGEGRKVVLASHGITANHMSWQAVAETLFRHSEGEVSLLALDHRGRAGSAGVSGPWGLSRHADDLARVLDHAGVDSAVVAGHSMGAFVAALFAENCPSRCEALLLLDGGLPIPLPLPPGDIDVEALVRAVIGPALARLEHHWPDIEAYVADFAEHPAFQPPNRFSDAADAYVRHDAVVGADGKVRSSVVREAVLEDGGAVIIDPELARAIERINTRTEFLWAPRGLVDQVPGLYSPEYLKAYLPTLAHVQSSQVEDCNHYTILVGEEEAGIVALHLLALAGLSA
ncbi:MAG: alpha/beta hydrolase [Gammaproteobacteria bacterium]|nr:MAG: alpha/beta hydrolase [Gammaproteobacteria bacterium]